MERHDDFHGMRHTARTPGQLKQNKYIGQLGHRTTYAHIHSIVSRAVSLARRFQQNKPLIPTSSCSILCNTT